jgi:hypothetical protein
VVGCFLVAARLGAVALAINPARTEDDYRVFAADC